MTRDEAYQILNQYIKNPNLIKHHLAAEAVMRSLYKKLSGKDYDKATEDTWGIVGLLHDADYETTKDHPEFHGLVLEKEIGDKLTSSINYAIKAHNWQNNGIAPKSLMDWSMYCCDELTGIIIACALVRPDKKLSSLTTESVLKKFNEKSFAKGAKRDQITLCEEKLKIPLNEFINLSLLAMQGISNELGL